MRLSTFEMACLFLQEKHEDLGDWIRHCSSIRYDASYWHCACHSQPICYNCTFQIFLKRIYDATIHYDQNKVPRDDVLRLCLFAEKLSYNSWLKLNKEDRENHRGTYGRILDNIENICRDWTFPEYEP